MSDVHEDFWSGALFAAAFAAGAFLFIWHSAESACQQTYNVYDCELSRNPFLPAEPFVEAGQAFGPDGIAEIVEGK